MHCSMLENEHIMFRDAFQKFIEKEITPYYPQWEKRGVVSRDVWTKAGQNGFLCLSAPELYGGLGINDFRYNSIIIEELARVGVSGIGFNIHTNIVAPYIIKFGTEEQKQKWLPGLVSGNRIGAIAMTEPNAGSDLANIQTTAIRQGDHYCLNGQKTFISNGILNDLVIVAVKTNSHRHSDMQSISLLVVERETPGYERGQKLEKIGLHAQDTAELFFHNVKVPIQNLLGDEGYGFYYLMEGLIQERLTIAINAIMSAETALQQTMKYCKDRELFGQSLGKFQNTRFKLAEMRTEVEIGRVFIDHCITLHNHNDLSSEKSAMAKWWTTDLQLRVINQCLQLHGGYGYMREYPIARAYIDSRAQSIYGGSNEILKDMIGKIMGF